MGLHHKAPDASGHSHGNYVMIILPTEPQAVMLAPRPRECLDVTHAISLRSLQGSDRPPNRSYYVPELLYCIYQAIRGS